MHIPHIGLYDVHGIPDKVVEPLKELYTETCSSVLSDGVWSQWFEVLNAVAYADLSTLTHSA